MESLNQFAYDQSVDDMASIVNHTFDFSSFNEAFEEAKEEEHEPAFDPNTPFVIQLSKWPAIITPCLSQEKDNGLPYSKLWLPYLEAEERTTESFFSQMHEREFETGSKFFQRQH